MKFHKRFRMSLGIFFIICEGLTFVYNILKYTKTFSDMSDSLTTTLAYVDAAVTGITLILDLIISIIFMRILLYYINNKQR
jgi:uncharacterized membrane protein YidH (DUF202 family)